MTQDELITQDAIRPELVPGERVLWSGRPRQGLVIRGSDAFAIPFSLFWAGFVTYWMYSVLSINAPFPLVLFGSLFVLMGIYVTVGRFFVDVQRRRKVAYALTSERVLIVSGIWTRNVKSINLKGLNDLTLSAQSDGWGTIALGPLPPFSWMMEGNVSWPGMEQRLGPRFELIPNARQVFELIRRTHTQVN